MSDFDPKNLLTLAKEKPFLEVSFQYLLGREASQNEAQILSEMMTLVIDHGPDSPSAQATISASKEGKDVLRSVEAGIHQINDKHGGAIEGCAQILQLEDFDPIHLVSSALAEGRRLPGFGHRIYKDEDPRTTYLFTRLSELALDSGFIQKAKAIEAELEKQKGKKLVMNIDCGMAVVLSELKIEPKLMNVFFLWPRVAGLVYRWSNI